MACLAAAQAALAGGGMDLPRVDMSGALALTAAYGVEPEVAAELLRYAAEGIAIGLAERRTDG